MGVESREKEHCLHYVHRMIRDVTVVVAISGYRITLSQGEAVFLKNIFFS